MSEKKLFIDLDICAQRCEECVINCSYFYHPGNNGMYSLHEIITYALVCRKCEEPHCVNSCPQNALEKQRDNLIRRYYMRCVGCKSCVHACPYGTIYPEMVPYIASKCDLCLDRRQEKPLCQETCPYGAVEVKEIKADESLHLYEVGATMVVHSTHWTRAKA